MSAQSVHGRGVPLWRQLANQLGTEIRSGARAPGSKLPSVAEQEASSGLSQSTTMRAYRELAQMGLAVAVSGSGTYVADPLPEESSPPTIAELAARVSALERALAELRENRCTANDV